MVKRILIIGGGPSGCSAGIFLQKAGFQVTLFERGGENREKVCGEGLTPEALNMLKKIGVLEKVRFKCQEVPSIKMFDLDGEPITFKNKCYTLKRSALDKILRDEVISLGGEVLYKTSIRKVDVKEDMVVVEDTGGKKHEGDVVLLATGAETSLAKSLGLGSVKDYSMVFMRGYAENTIDCGSLDFYFPKEIFPNGAWVFPLPGNVLNIGVGAPRGVYKTNNIGELMDKFIDILNEKYNGSIKEVYSSKKWIINTGLQTENIFSDRVLLCGENIASAYNFSGEGVAPALKTGFYAAETIINAKGDYSRNGLAIFKDLVEKGIGPEHKIYNIMYRILTNRFGSRVVCWFLRNSKRMKKLVEGVIDEKVPLEKGFVSAVFYSRKL